MIDPSGTPDDAAAAVGPGVVVHVNDNDVDHLTAVLRNVANLVRDLDGAAPVEVVAHGSGLDLVLTGGPFQDALNELVTGGGVGFVGCGNSLRGRNLPTEAVLPGVRIVPAGVGQLTRRQWQGWAYLHP